MRCNCNSFSYQIETATQFQLDQSYQTPFSPRTFSDLQNVVSPDRKLEESIWEAALLIGLPEVGSAASVFMIFIMALNVALQWVFVTSVRIGFLDPHYADESDYSNWRYSEGHAYSTYDRVRSLHEAQQGR